MQLNIIVASEQKMQSLIAKALGTDLNMSVQLSMKAVSSLVELNRHLLTVHQIKGIAVRIISIWSMHGLIFAVI